MVEEDDAVEALPGSFSAAVTRQGAQISLSLHVAPVAAEVPLVS
jgi:hypothetical protein